MQDNVESNSYYLFVVPPNITEDRKPSSLIPYVGGSGNVLDTCFSLVLSLASDTVKVKRSFLGSHSLIYPWTFEEMIRYLKSQYNHKLDLFFTTVELI